MRVADNLAPEALRRLAHHLIDTVLQQPAATGARLSAPWPFPPGDRSRPTNSEADLFYSQRVATRDVVLYESERCWVGSSRWRVEDLPAEARTLLAHNDHMTVALESFHQVARFRAGSGRMARRSELRADEPAESPDRMERSYNSG